MNKWNFGKPRNTFQSLLLALGIYFFGLLIEVVFNHWHLRIPSWPRNLMVLVALLLYIVALSQFNKVPIIWWLSRPRASIGAIAIYTVQVILMGIIPQVPGHGGSLIEFMSLNNIAESWPFILTSFYLLIILGLVTIRRLKPVNVKNVGFFLNHAGLWIVIATASFGTGDLVRMHMTIKEGSISNTAVSNTGRQYKVPIAVQLLDFRIEEYSPNLLVLNKRNETKSQLFSLENKEGEMGDYELKVLKYYPESKIDQKIFSLDTVAGAAPAAMVELTYREKGSKWTGWVSCGSFRMPSRNLNLFGDEVLIMTKPKAREFSSDVRIYRSSNDYEDHYIEVNKPIKVSGYRIYQTGYDEKFGKWSPSSTLELVRDPWITSVYVGIFMMLAGAIYLFWAGSQQEKEEL